MTGCVDSSPILTTEECPPAGETTITIHGSDFTADGQVREKGGRDQEEGDNTGGGARG